MSSATNVAHPQSASFSHFHSRSWFRIFLIGGISAALLISAGVVLCIKFWPFSKKEVVQDLAEASDSGVTIHSYHPTYVPVPGCVLYGVEFRHGQHNKDLITIQKLRIMGSYSGILRHYVPRIIAEGARVFIPAFGSKTIFHSQHSDIKIGEIVANGTLVEFASSDSHASPLTFDVHDALLTEVRWGSPIGYRLKFRNPNPPGELSVNGKFGAWADGHPEDTPMSGDYTFEKANLAVYDGIAGLLSSKGRFEGLLKHIDVSGSIDTPDFEVRSSGHKVGLRTQFNAYVNAQNGDVFLNHVEARFKRTTVVADGSVAHGKAHSGRDTNVHLTSRDGRVEDILGLFVTDPRSPMAGPISLDARAELPSGDDSFLDKLHLGGEFLIREGKFTHPDTQLDVDKLSAGARGKNKDIPEEVVTDLRGKVDMRHALSDFSDLDFGIPGAHAKLHGTYNVENHRVNLHGHMRVETKISNTSSGMKSFLLKVLDPIFKKRKEGEVVPVHIMGTYEKPDIGLDLQQNGKNKQAKK
jgi:hypothetical protein